MNTWKYICFLYTFLQICHALPTLDQIYVPNIDPVQPQEVNSLRFQRRIDSPSVDPKVEQLERIITDVQKILASNPSLPRLTRGEIIDIIENITKTDLELAHKLNNREQKALMLVFPHTPSNDADIQELYTKAPITYIVGGDESKPNQLERKKPYNKKINKNKLESLPTFKKIPENTGIKLENLQVPTSSEASVGLKELQKVTLTLSTEPSSTTKAPTIQSSKTPLKRKKITTTTAAPVTQEEVTKKLIRKRPTVKVNDKYSNHKYTENLSSTTPTPVTISDSGIRIISPPKFIPKPPHQFAQNEEPLSILNINDFLSSHSPRGTTRKPVILDELSVPDDLRNAVKDIDLLVNISPNKQGSFEGAAMPFKIPSASQTATRDIFVSITDQTSTTTKMPDVSNVAEHLSSDMQDLLVRFGLIPDPNKKTTPKPTFNSFTPEVIPINPSSYVNFKPLPDTPPAGDEMIEFLSQFGLTTGSKRSQKALKSSDIKNMLQEEKNATKKVKHAPIEETTPETIITTENFEDVTDYFEETTEENVQNNESFSSDESKIIENHVFNPTDVPAATQEELENLEKLMEAIKQLEKINGTATEEDLKHIDIDGLKQLVASLNQAQRNLPLDQQAAPDPMNYDFGESKNEVKRQETTTSTITTAATTTTEEPKNANLEALAESFGGASSTTTEAPETTPASRRSGFYYLVDWNSFLEIDNQKGKSVNLRLQPKVGDPKRFYSVSVP